MPNIIELNLLENKSIVAKMQGIPLANENSYKIIAGEENATIFKVVSIPNQYADKSFTIEMVNAKGYGIEETPIVNITNYEFSLPVGMAVAGYSYILFRCKYTENGKQVVVPFQPIKVKVWNTIPQWQDYVDKTANVKVVDGYLILTENGNEYNLGYVKGDKGADGKDILSNKELQGVSITIEDLLSGSVPSGVYNINPHNELGIVSDGSPLLLYVIDNTFIMGGQTYICIDVHNNVYVYSMYEQKWNKTTKSFGEIAGTIYEGNKGAQNAADIKNLYAITKANNLYALLKTEQAYNERITANGANIVDKQYAPVTKIQGATVFAGDGFNNAFFVGIKSASKNLLNVEGDRLYTEGVFTFDKGKITSTGTSDSATTFVVYSKEYPAGTYTFSAQSLSYSSYRMIIATNTQPAGTEFNPSYTNRVGKNCYFKAVANTTKYFTFTAPSKFNIGVIMYLPASVADRTCIVDEILLVKGNAQENYVDFGEDTGFRYDYPIELGEWDYALPQEGKVRKSTVIYEFTGNETIQAKSSVVTGTHNQAIYYYNVLLSNPIPKIGASDRYLLSNMTVKHPDSANIPDVGIYWGGWSNEPSVVFWSKQEVDFWATKEYLQSWLATAGVSIAYATDETEGDYAPQRNTTIAYKDGTETVVGNKNSDYGAIPTITQEYFELVGGDE